MVFRDKLVMKPQDQCSWYGKIPAKSNGEREKFTCESMSEAGTAETRAFGNVCKCL